MFAAKPLLRQAPADHAALARNSKAALQGCYAKLWAESTERRVLFEVMRFGVKNQRNCPHLLRARLQDMCSVCAWRATSSHHTQNRAETPCCGGSHETCRLQPSNHSEVRWFTQHGNHSARRRALHLGLHDRGSWTQWLKTKTRKHEWKLQTAQTALPKQVWQEIL